METSADKSENRYIAKILDEVADLLEQQNASSFRITAYRAAAEYVARSARPLREVHRNSGLKGLEHLPTIGSSIAQAVAEILDTGSLSILARLRGTMDPEELFQTVPTIGPHIARQIHDELNLETLEALEAAAIDGRLSTLKGIGPRRVRSIKHSLARILDRRRPAQKRGDSTVPPMEVLLEVDRDYRTKAKRGALATILPKRFNPTGDMAGDVIRWHVVAMFAPSFFTGFLIKRFGTGRIAMTGLALLIAAALSAATGLSSTHFYGSLILLGIGWNFGFIGATSMLANAVPPEEKSIVQGVNDTIIALASTAFAFAAGAIVAGFGWAILAIVALTILALAFGTLAFQKRQPV